MGTIFSWKQKQQQKKIRKQKTKKTKKNKQIIAKNWGEL